jgi:hypothetical protein
MFLGSIARPSCKAGCLGSTSHNPIGLHSLLREWLASFWLVSLWFQYFILYCFEWLDGKWMTNSKGRDLNWNDRGLLDILLKVSRKSLSSSARRARLVFGMIWVGIPARTATVLTDEFRGFILSPQGNNEIVPRFTRLLAHLLCFAIINHSTIRHFARALLNGIAEKQLLFFYFSLKTQRSNINSACVQDLTVFKPSEFCNIRYFRCETCSSKHSAVNICYFVRQCNTFTS